MRPQLAIRIEYAITQQRPKSLCAMTKSKVIELGGQDSFYIFRIDSEQDIIAWDLLIKGRSILFKQRIMQLDSVSFSGCLGDL
jgi:hypothetical protein